MELVTTDAQKEVGTALEQAQAFVIKSNEDFALVDAHCAGLLALKKKVEGDFKASKESTYAAWKAVVAQEKGHLDGIDEARRIDKTKMDAWTRHLEAERQAEEARLRAEAQKRAEDEAIARAQAMNAAGQKEEAEAIIAAPVEVAPVIVPKTAPKASTVMRKVPKFRIVDASKIPREFMTPDEKKIGAVVRAMRYAANIPGIEVYEEIA